MWFKIDSNQTESIRRKSLKRLAKNVIPALVLTFAFFMMINGSTGNLSHTAIANGVAILITVFCGWLGFKKAISNQLSLQIELSSDGIKRIMQGSDYTSIPWSSLDIDYTKYGEIILVDKKVHNLARKWTGKGQIIVPNELDNHSQFKTIVKRMRREYELQHQAAPTLAKLQYDN